jgi:hypothetical protein
MNSTPDHDDAPAEDDQAIERILATPGNPRYPDVTVHLSTGCDGNMGSVMDKVRSALRDAGEDTNVMNQIWREVLDAGSFTEALHIVMCWVNVT